MKQAVLNKNKVGGKVKGNLKVKNKKSGKTKSNVSNEALALNAELSMQKAVDSYVKELETRDAILTETVRTLESNEAYIASLVIDLKNELTFANQEADTQKDLKNHAYELYAAAKLESKRYKLFAYATLAVFGVTAVVGVTLTLSLLGYL